MAARVVSPELVGREAELAALAAALDDAQRGRARAILIGGEAGIGKSRLLAEWLERAFDRARVLRGDCIPIAEGSLPFAPLAEAIRPLVRDRDGEISPVLRGVAPELALVADGSTAMPEAEVRPEWARARVYERFLDLLRSLARERPVVLALEDLHWADASTLELLSFIARAGRADRLLVVGTFRSDELVRRHPLRAWLGEVERLAQVERVELCPLDRNEVARQIGAILRRVPLPRFVDSVHARADGNPFFVEELVAAGAEPGASIPTLRDVLTARLESVSDRTLELLGVAAVIGRQMDHQLLGTVAGLGEGALCDALDEAIRAGLLVVADSGKTERYSFRHALLAEAAAHTVLPARRRRLHVAIAEALAASPPLGRGEDAGRLGEIAHHWFEAHDAPKALTASLAAAEVATAAGGYPEAYRQYQRAVDLWADDEAGSQSAFGMDRIELLRRTAQAALFAGEFDAAVASLRDAINRAESTGEDTVRQGLLYERLGRALYECGAFADALAAYERAVELVPDRPGSQDRIRVMAGYARMLAILSRATESLEVAQQALVAARETGSRQLEGNLLTTIGIGLGEGVDAERGIELLREALAIATQVNDVDDMFRAYSNLLCALSFVGRNEEAVGVGLVGLELARNPAMTSTWGAFLGCNVAVSLVVLGRWDEALRFLREIEDGAVGIASIGARIHLSSLLVLRGDVDEAASMLETLEAQLGPGADPQWISPLAMSQIELALETGDLQAGRRAAERALPALATTDDVFLHVWVLLAALKLEAAVAERARAARDRAKADEAVDLATNHLAVLSAHVGNPGTWTRAAVLQAVALAEAEMSRVRNEPDPQRWRDVLVSADGTTGVHDLAYARFRLAESLLATTHGRAARDEAHAILAQAYEAAVMLGARPLRSRIESLAARSRLSLETAGRPALRDTVNETPGSVRDRRAIIARYGLTSREIEVLRLLARGSTNRQIGEALFITESTAGVHVSHILAKLEVRGRVEAATIAARLGIAE